MMDKSKDLKTHLNTEQDFEEYKDKISDKLGDIV